MAAPARSPRLTPAQRAVARVRARDFSRDVLTEWLRCARDCVRLQHCPLCRTDARIYVEAIRLQRARPAARAARHRPH